MRKNNTKTYEHYVVPIFPRVQVIDGGPPLFFRLTFSNMGH